MKFKCSVCLSDSVISRSIMSRDNFAIELFECTNCGHVSQNPETFEDIYSSGEFSKIAREGSTLPNKKKIISLDKKAFERFEFYQGFILANNNFLEVGSSIGSFVFLLKMAGKEANGLEPDPNYAAFSDKQYGFSQHSSLLEEFNTERKFDAACSFHVIEHIEKPQIFVERLSKLLNIGAEILFECPSYEIHSFGDMKKTIWKPHIHYFSAPSFYFLFSQYFHVELIAYYGASIYIKAKNAGASTFDENTFDKYKRQAKRIFNANSKIPRVISKLPLKQLFIQSVIQKGTLNKLLKKGISHSAYKIAKHRFHRKEKGNVGDNAFQLTNFNRLENNASDLIFSKCVRNILREDRKIKFEIETVVEEVNEHIISRINNSKFCVIDGDGLLLPKKNKNTNFAWKLAISQENIQKINVPLVVYAIDYILEGKQPDDFFLKDLNLLQTSRKKTVK